MNSNKSWVPDFSDLASEIKPHKVGPYTVTTIGGPEEYKLWKKRQEERNVIWKQEYEARLALKKTDAIRILNGEQAPSPDYAKTVQDQLKASIQRNKELSTKAYVPPPPVKLTWIEKIANWMRM